MNRILPTLLLAAFAVTTQAADTLRSMLPTDAVAYLRLVGPDGFSGAAPGTALDRAISAGGNATELGNIAKGLLKGLEADKQARDQAPWLEFIYRLRAPVEAALLLRPKQPLATGRLLIRAGIEADSVVVMNALLQGIAADDDELDLTTPLGADGVGGLTSKGAIPIWLRFDPKAKLLYAMAGIGLDRKGFEASLKALGPQPEPADMAALERQVDTSGQGPLLWLDVPRVLEGMVAAQAAPQMMSLFMGLQGVKGAVLGWGTRDGKGRLSLVLDAPKTNSLTRMLPPIVNDFSLTTRGRPGLLLSLNIPGPALLQLAEGLLGRNPEAGAKFREGKQRIEDELGMTAQELVGIVGPEIVAFSDDLGIFIAVRVGDPAALDKLLQYFSINPAVDYETRNVAGETYHHLVVRTSDDEAAADSDAADSQKSPLSRYFLTLSKAVRTHLYWVQDGDWLVFGQLPQSLYDRTRSKDKLVIGDWLRDQQSQDAGNALLLVSAAWDNVPRLLYYSYLEWLESAADVAGTSIDMFARPGATELQLPMTGSYGLQLSLGDPYLGLELSFEANPLEFVFGGSGMTTVAIAGILAAVAIPAYQDYILRAKVNQAMMELHRGKLAVSEFHQAHGMLPSDRESAGLSPDAGDVSDELLASMTIENGRVTIVFGADAPEKLRGKSISMTPYKVAGDDSFLHWRCGYASLDGLQVRALRTESGKAVKYVEPTLERRYLPASCR